MQMMTFRLDIVDNSENGLQHEICIRGHGDLGNVARTSNDAYYCNQAQYMKWYGVSRKEDMEGMDRRSLGTRHIEAQGTCACVFPLTTE